ncbi:hypothetical protein G7046_g7566 [Stylonectria norvegica]|nr:hypothetical protein G7046_g7566 [Stylonectria norvegica]
MSPPSGRRGSQPSIYNTRTFNNTTTTNDTTTTSSPGTPSFSSGNTSTNNSAGPTSPETSVSESELQLVRRIHNTALHTPSTLPGGCFRGRFQDHPYDFSNVIENSSDSDFNRSSPKSKSKAKAKAQSKPAKDSSPKHFRSLSQPFPFNFTFGKWKKKRQTSVCEPIIHIGPSDTDDDVFDTMPRQTTKTHTRSGHAGSKDFGDVQFGNCMTCGSRMRWPKEQKAFKCAICAAVNHLAPARTESQASEGARGHRHTNQGPPRQISLDHTKRLIRQCVQSHLNRCMLGTPGRHLKAQGPSRHSFSFSNRVQASCLILGINDATQPDATFMADPSEASKSISNHDSTVQSPLRASTTNKSRSYSTSHSEASHSDRPIIPGALRDGARIGHQNSPSGSSAYINAAADNDTDPQAIFKPLEDYLRSCFSSLDCINSSFTLHQPRHTSRRGSEPLRRRPAPRPELREPPEQREQRERREQREQREQRDQQEQREKLRPGGMLSDLDPKLDPKLLLIGDIAENGTWWTGHDETLPRRSPVKRVEDVTPKPSTAAKFIMPMNWGELMQWYAEVINPASVWSSVYEDISQAEGTRFRGLTDHGLQMMEKELLQAQEHARGILLLMTEALLKRPGRPLLEPCDLRFLLIVLENPLLHPDVRQFCGTMQPLDETPEPKRELRLDKPAKPATGPLSGQHSGIIKRVIGMISNSSPEFHNQMTMWLARYHPTRFSKAKELVSGFLTYRLLRQHGKKREVKVDVTAGLIPQLQEGRSGFYLYDEITELSSGTRKHKEPPKKMAYTEDWQITAATRTLSLFFTANNHPHLRRTSDALPSPHENNVANAGHSVHAHGQLLPTSDFYVSLLDNADLVFEFQNWEAKESRFSFCQYPFVLSIWAKTQILEHDAHRQMKNKARDALFNNLNNHTNVNQYLDLDIRRDCLVDDSLKQVSATVGALNEDVKKQLRIKFRGEEGIDAGGLRKEWFLLLVREVFHPDHDMFLYDEDSQTCYFNPNSFEASSQFFLVGVVLGLAIYNSTILDVALPPFAFRKLIASAPTKGVGAPAHPRPPMRYTLDDLAEYRPRLAKGLRQLLAYEGDVEETFGVNFVVQTDNYGTTVEKPLCPGGEHIAVTNNNRREYVDLYVRYVLDTAVTRQFMPFKMGFYSVCGGNALSLFRPEEIELLIRGSDEVLDIAALRGVAQYENWGHKNESIKQLDGSEPTIEWFWASFRDATPRDQRKLLLFITGSDRIPATGAASLPIKIVCLGDDKGRFPIARTCFNQISLFRYQTKIRLETVLWTAVHESEGFGLA